MTQDPLFFEDFRGAVDHLVKMLGGHKVVGGMLRPGWPVKKASDWVSDCLNPDRQTKFDFEDISALLAEGRARGIHCASWQLADETGYERPGIAPTKTPDQLLAEQMSHHLSEFKRLADERAAAQTMAEVRAVK